MNSTYIIEDSLPSLGMGTRLKDSFGTITGKVSLTLTDLDTGKVTFSKSSNQVVYLGRHNVMRIVCGGTVDATMKVLNTIRFSDGAVATGGDHMNPKAPTITDTALFQTNAAKIKTFTTAVPTFSTLANNTLPVATFTKTITTSDINGLINEAGLYFGSNGPMFAHYTFPTLDMRAGTNNSLKVDWEFNF